jgi:hypothetical protein
VSSRSGKDRKRSESPRDKKEYNNGNGNNNISVVKDVDNNDINNIKDKNSVSRHSSPESEKSK